jgi:hypothetical protein
LIALLMAAVLAPSLAACSGNPIQGFVKDATGGGVDIAGDKLPADFPAEVPLVSATVVAGIGLGQGEDKIWNVTVKVEGSSTVKDDVVTKFTDAGWTEGAPIQTANGVIYTDGTYTALVIVIEDGDNWTVNYIVGTDASAVQDAA